MTTSDEARARITEQAQRDSQRWAALEKATAEANRLAEEIEKAIERAFQKKEWRQHDQ